MTMPARLSRLALLLGACALLPIVTVLAGPRALASPRSLAAPGSSAAGSSATARSPELSRSSGVGWLRLAHLSPNTPAVDVYLYSFGDAKAHVVLRHVSYGTVSPYFSAASTPVLSTSVRVTAKGAYTVAGMGPASGLRLQIFKDTLGTPHGKALVRVV